MSLPTYAELSRTLGVQRCVGIDATGQPCLHPVHGGRVADGDYDRRSGLIHWDDHLPTKVGIYHFLRLVAESRTYTPGHYYWIHRYRALRMIPALARRAHIRVSRSAGEEDRLALRAMLYDIPPSTLRDEALAWARRS